MLRFTWFARGHSVVPATADRRLVRLPVVHLSDCSPRHVIARCRR